MRYFHALLCLCALSTTLAENAVLRREPNTISVGPVFSWFDYREIVTLDDIAEIHAGYRIEGEPKSTEHGAVFGIAFSYERLLGRLPLRFSPGLELGFGLNNRYDGSTQGDFTYDSTIVFEPVQVQKDNLFLHNTLLLHYIVPLGRVNIELGTGAYLSVWYRDFPYGNSELYAWVNVPIELRGVFALGENASVALGATVAPMVHGGMDVYFNDAAYALLGYDVNATMVKLGNRLRYRGDLQFALRPSNLLGFRLGLNAQFYEFGRSNTGKVYLEEHGVPVDTSVYIEPASKTSTLGFFFRVQFFPGSTRGQ